MELFGVSKGNFLGSSFILCSFHLLSPNLCPCPVFPLQNQENVKAMRNLRYYIAQLPCIFIESFIVAPQTYLILRINSDVEYSFPDVSKQM